MFSICVRYHRRHASDRLRLARVLRLQQRCCAARVIGEALRGFVTPRRGEKRRYGMPTIQVQMLLGRSREQKREMAEVFTREMARIAKCGESDVQIIFDEVPKENWAVGGVLNDER
ncbi:hypothetical protein EFQ99_19580 [Rhizobium vallis]|uniref:4-oxalocrotonate tautomerase-like domain-containing protein n=1 Tax=Rhizobium vallis TaxID=634290 RepID=A0A3S0TAY2_9HYPH|nr:tautomerase family protein [Rhizobium vallis]RUM24147.1 hypothetical protein EFQ99_19580 [Rhizobium vallis]